MITVGIHELKQRASELIHLVHESGSEIQITYRGKVVALLIPVTPPTPPKEAQAWAEMESLLSFGCERFPMRFRDIYLSHSSLFGVENGEGCQCFIPNNLRQ